MFRFSIRDLFWLTLVVAVVCGWLVRERQLRDRMNRVSDDATKASEQATKWRLATGGLEDAISRTGWKVEWNVSASWVRLSYPIMSTNQGIRVTQDFCEPSVVIE